jgi:hypothetical protein
MGCGVPVLISDPVNTWREIDADGAGFIAGDDLPGTISLLRRWLDSSPQEIEAVRQRARRCFAERFHIRHATHQLVEILRANGIQDRKAFAHEGV